LLLLLLLVVLLLHVDLERTMKQYDLVKNKLKRKQHTRNTSKHRENATCAW